jgi:hypothetical protein
LNYLLILDYDRIKVNKRTGSFLEVLIKRTGSFVRDQPSPANELISLFTFLARARGQIGIKPKGSGFLLQGFEEAKLKW